MYIISDWFWRFEKELGDRLWFEESNAWGWWVIGKFWRALTRGGRIRIYRGW